MDQIATQIFTVALLTGLILFGAEIFVPGGVLGTIGALALLTAMITGFFAFPQHGPAVAVGIVFLIGIAIALWIKLFPKTRIGRGMTVQTDLATFKATQEGSEALAGKTGVAASDLRPSGFCSIDGRRVDVVTSGEMIDKGKPVRVVSARGNRIVVESMPENEAQQQAHNKE